MKLMNYDKRTLIMQNVRSVHKEYPSTFTSAQYQILCNLIRQKHISRAFFQLLLSELYEVENWRSLTYQQMYELIHILTYYQY